ncbi:hypothetical protein Xedl_00175 [Xenorhabdus eapokensis]|uniref:Uncharacterized protein n=1 Tax=Xenorhabdus eapokensis TaxID=1873482 RepID=A0A1Q5TZP1_9GAMM|nr:hypothetical protein Xedl_00175 [Xenorhabdus eapokensis]
MLSLPQKVSINEMNALFKAGDYHQSLFLVQARNNLFQNKNAYI